MDGNGWNGASKERHFNAKMVTLANIDEGKLLLSKEGRNHFLP